MRWPRMGSCFGVLQPSSRGTMTCEVVYRMKIDSVLIILLFCSNSFERSGFVIKPVGIRDGKIAIDRVNM